VLTKNLCPFVTSTASVTAFVATRSKKLLF